MLVSDDVREFNKNGIEFKLDAVDFLRLPSPQCKQVIVERTASVGAVSYTPLDVYQRQPLYLVCLPIKKTIGLPLYRALIS